jgi:hypothetical protein
VERLETAAEIPIEVAAGIIAEPVG